MHSRIMQTWKYFGQEKKEGHQHFSPLCQNYKEEDQEGLFVFLGQQSYIGGGIVLLLVLGAWNLTKTIFSQ